MEKRIEKLEDHFTEMQKVLFKMAANIDSINQNISKSIEVDEKVIRQDERQKVNEKRFLKIEDKQDKFQDLINGVNLKIAYASGGWAVIVYGISKL